MNDAESGRLSGFTTRFRDQLTNHDERKMLNEEIDYLKRQWTIGVAGFLKQDDN